MALEPHDLLKIAPKNIISHSPIPAWAVHSVETTPLVVVRRVHAPEGQVAIGIRGRARNERFAAFLPEHCVNQQIKPEHLTTRDRWKDKQLPAFSTIEFAADLLEGHGFIWGLSGSVGFELASGVETVTLNSDLDLIIRAPEPLPIHIAAQVVDEFNKRPIRIDVQVETPVGAFSLMEYARGGNRPILLRTTFGPKLSSNPWGESENGVFFG